MKIKLIIIIFCAILLSQCLIEAAIKKPPVKEEVTPYAKTEALHEAVHNDNKAREDKRRSDLNTINLKTINTMSCDSKFYYESTETTKADVLISLISALGNRDWCNFAQDMKTEDFTTDDGDVCHVTSPNKLNWDSTFEHPVMCGKGPALGLKPYSKGGPDLIRKVVNPSSVKMIPAYISPEVSIKEVIARNPVVDKLEFSGNNFYRLRLLKYNPLLNAKYLVCSLTGNFFDGVTINPELSHTRLIQPAKSKTATYNELCVVKHICETFGCTEESVNLSEYKKILFRYPGPHWNEVLIKSRLFKISE